MPRPRLPHSFQARLTLGFVAVVAFTLVLVAGLALNRLDDYFAAQERQNVATRATAVANVLRVFVEREATNAGEPVLAPSNRVSPAVSAFLARNEEFMEALARIGQADLKVRIGSTTQPSASAPDILVPAPGASWSAVYNGPALTGQSRSQESHSYIFKDTSGLIPWAMEITLSNPFTYRATTIADLTVVLVLVALVALAVALLLASILARRFTTPIRRLTETSRVIAGGDLSARVAGDLGSPLEIATLSRQFNLMAERLEESVEFIRRDRDRSRDFLADVSHELRTPIAALRTFNELLREGAANDPAARDEFLESSSQQLERLDWLAQNLLELSKLDSGLVLLDLRPDDLRSAVESSVEQAEALAHRRGIALTVHLPKRPLRIRHDPQRIAQVVSNLIGNAIKFTERGGTVTVDLEPHRDGARIRVSDTGVGIDTAELPRIFERFYRGTRANEARSSGSGLGLAIVRSIVDMHEGRVTVESRLGAGSTFTVYLPHDPREGGIEPEPAPETDAATARSAG
ncbi:MAG TPA: HAMP domain-containing sensor histidine kinase [Candidatus Limnocylindrales bacterium]